MATRNGLPMKPETRNSQTSTTSNYSSDSGSNSGSNSDSNSSFEQGRSQSRQATSGALTRQSSGNSQGGNQAGNQSGNSDEQLNMLVKSLMSNVGGSQALHGAVGDFASLISEMTSGNANETITAVQDTYQHATQTVTNAKETFDLGKRAFDTLRTASKEVFAKVKENPEPFVAAAVPVAIGLLMLLRTKTQNSGTMNAGNQRRTEPRELNI